MSNNIWKLHIYVFLFFSSQAEDKAEILNKELLATKSQLTEAEDEKKQWELEANQVKEMCRRELDRLDTEIKRSNTIIADYKQVQNITIVKPLLHVYAQTIIKLSFYHYRYAVN